MISPLLLSPSLLLPAAFLYHTVSAWQRVVRRDRTARCVRRRGAVLARVHRRFQGRATSRRRGGPRQRLGLRSETSHRRGPGDGTYIHRGDHQARWRSTWPSVPTLRVPLAQCAGDVPHGKGPVRFTCLPAVLLAVCWPHLSSCLSVLVMPAAVAGIRLSGHFLSQVRLTS